MNIYYDENMPYASEFFKDFGTLHPFSGRSLTADDIKDADVLLVRSITQVNKALLAKNNHLKFVGTATIGVDHIDQAYLASRGIGFSSSPGCNAISVAEYVISSLVVLAERYCLTLSEMTVGIVGAGNTGTRLSEKLTALGIRHLLCDPILADNGEDQRLFSSLDEVLSCDVVSLHVPKTMTGPHATYHMLDHTRLANFNDQQILINACRGEIIDNQALLALKKAGMATKVVLDVWENEPAILTELIPYCEIATAHIAGYSLEGKARGTEMLYQALCQQLELSSNKQLNNYLADSTITGLTINQPFSEIMLNQMVKLVYDVRRDDGIFRQKISSQGFDTIRKTYPARREFSAMNISLTNLAQSDVWHHLGFNTK
ncbi:MAG: 4-phosphoerythronate dehydrogenase [Thalassotalea sp.]